MAMNPRRLIPALLLIAAAALAQAPPPRPAAPPPPPAPPPAAPAEAPAVARDLDRTQAIILLRGTLLALHHANLTGNYTVLRDMGAAPFQASNNAARLAEIFANLRAGGVDLAPVAVLEPEFEPMPRIEADGTLRLQGSIPTQNLRLGFDLRFLVAGARAGINGISLTLAPVVSTEPPAAAPARPANPPAARPAQPPRPANPPPANPAPANR